MGQKKLEDQARLFDNHMYLLHTKSSLLIQKSVHAFCESQHDIHIDLRCERYEYPDLRKPNLDKWFILDRGIEKVEHGTKGTYMYEVCENLHFNLEDQIAVADRLVRHFAPGEILIGHGCLTTMISAELKKQKNSKLEVRINYIAEAVRND